MHCCTKKRRIYRFLHIQAGISFNWIFAGEHAIMRPVECAKSSASNSAAQREESLSRGSKTFPKTISYILNIVSACSHECVVFPLFSVRDQTKEGDGPGSSVEVLKIN